MFAAIIIIASIRTFQRIPFTETNKPNGYDEQMWTSASITSYHMFFKGHVRPTKELDNWFPTYAWQKGVDVFTGDSSMINYMSKTFQYNPDTIHFPYDQVTINNKKQQYMLAIQYDTVRFPRKDFQWFDRATWTFGWKAPNFGKYIMGWWIQTFAKNKPNPNGYFAFYVPSSEADSGSTKHVPSLKPSGAPYSYAPEEYQKLARQPNAFMTILAIAAVFITGWLFFNFWVGFIAGTWLTLNKTFIVINCIVGLDSFAVSLSAIAFLLMMWTIKSIQKNDPWWKIILWAVGTGLITSFALSSKLNAGMMVFIAGLTFGISGLIALWKGWKLKNLKPLERFTPFIKSAIAGVLIGVISIMLFIKLNPQVQKQPQRRIAAMRGSIDDYFDRRARIFTSNQITDRLKAVNQEIILISKQPGANQQALMSIYTQLGDFGKRYNEEMQRNSADENKFHIEKSTKYLKDIQKLEKEVQKLNPDFEPNTKFVNWVEVKHSWPKACELVLKRIAVVDPQTPDRYYGTFGSLVKVKYNFLDGFFAVIGLVFCLILAWKQWKEKKEFYSYGILLLSFLLIFYGNVDFVWQDWPRYMTPIFPLYSLVIAVGLFEGGKFIKEKIAARKKKPVAPIKAKK